MSKDIDRPVWFEGMTLDPHHLQQWDRYTQRTIHGQVSSAVTNGWGFTKVAVSAERIANGEVAVERAAGIFPDGLYFDVPATDQPPAPRTFGSHFDATSERLKVYLAVPLYSSQRANFNQGQVRTNSDDRRFLRSSVSLADETTGTTERTIEVARPNLQILFEGEDMTSYSTIQLTEIVRESSGTPVENSRFVPPSLRVNASSNLAGVASRILELAVAKMTDIGQKASMGLAAGDAASSDLKAVGIAAALGSYIPLLKEHGNSDDSTPRQLYETLIGFAGALSVFAPSSTSLTQYPLYKHDDLTRCFKQMEDVLREVLGGTHVARTYKQVDLQLNEQGLFSGEVGQDILSSTRVVLAVDSAVTVTDSVTQSLESHMRVASPASMNKALTAFLQALPFERSGRSVRGFTPSDRTVLFDLSKSGEYWETIQNEEAITVWVPPECNVNRVSVIAVGT